MTSGRRADESGQLLHCPDSGGRLRLPLVPLDRADPMPLWAQLEAGAPPHRCGSSATVGSRPISADRGLRGQSPHRARSDPSSQQDRSLRQRGRGTVINRSEFEQPLGTLYSLFQSIESTGTEQTSEVLELAVVTDSIAAAQLQIDEDTELFHLARLRRAGGEPLAVDGRGCRWPLSSRCFRSTGPTRRR